MNNINVFLQQYRMMLCCMSELMKQQNLKEFTITKEQLSQWESLMPGVNIERNVYNGDIKIRMSIGEGKILDTLQTGKDKNVPIRFGKNIQGLRRKPPECSEGDADSVPS